MNWLTKAINFGEKIKKVLKKRPSKSEIENSDWTSCCKGPVLKKDLEENLWVCNSCGKHHRISCRQRFDIFFGKNRYELLETPIPSEDILNWKDTKTYKERLKDARKKTGQNSAVMIAKGKINGINIGFTDKKITAYGGFSLLALFFEKIGLKEAVGKMIPIKEIYEKYLACSGIVTDTRMTKENEMFFALKGDNFNGNEYALEALEKGCKWVVVEEKEYCINERFILVENTLNTLQQLANYHRKKLGIPVLAITGTNGKTTTKELIVRVLQKKYKA